MRQWVIVLLSGILCACVSSHGFDRGALRSQVASQREVTEEEIKMAIAARPQLPHPFTLAVYFKPPAKPAWYEQTQWFWTREDKDRLLAAFAALRSAGVLSDIRVIPETAIEGGDSKAIRLAAAHIRADAVLMITGAADIDRYNNILGPLYILLVTGAFIPGTVADGLFMASASLWDVGNPFLYLGAEAEALVSKTRPAFFIEEKQILKAAKSKALDTLAEDLGRRLTQLSRK